MNIIAVTNRKGGVGKSTMAVHLAAYLARKKRIALVDTDSQGHSGLMLGMPERDGLFEVLINKAPIGEVVMPVPMEKYRKYPLSDDEPAGSLRLLPSAARTYQIPYMLKPEESFLFFRTIEDLGALLSLDAVIIDTSPTMSQLDGAIYLAADYYVYVTECEMLSLDGVMSAIVQLQRFAEERRRYLNRDSTILGIIPNKQRDTLVHRHNLAQLVERFGDLVLPPVGLRTLWTEASNLHQTIFTYAPHGKEAAEAQVIVDRLERALWPEEMR